ncbi:MAG: hypothetical protein ACREV1_05155 [Gammaproteobacteria bacterium]
MARAITAIQITTAPPVIHQKISAMRSAPRPAGSSVDWMPPQPINDSAPRGQTAIFVVPHIVLSLLAGAHPHPLGEEEQDRPLG